MIDICMTACVRPKIIEKTLMSFKEKLFKNYPTRLIINIDPVGEVGYRSHIIDQLFHLEVVDDIVLRCPPEPSFPKAFKWVWEQATSKYIFHLEDDWELLRDVDLNKMFAILEKYPDLALLRLPKFPAVGNMMKNWNRFFPWNGEFYECPKEMRHRVGFCGHPSLIKGKWLGKVLFHLNDKGNPEKQIQFPEKTEKLYNEIVGWRYGVWAKPGDPPVIKDIGREWIEKTNWRKQGNKSFFIKWEMVNGGKNCS